MVGRSESECIDSGGEGQYVHTERGTEEMGGDRGSERTRADLMGVLGWGTRAHTRAKPPTLPGESEMNPNPKPRTQPRSMAGREPKGRMYVQMGRTRGGGYSRRDGKNETRWGGMGNTRYGQYQEIRGKEPVGMGPGMFGVLRLRGVMQPKLWIVRKK